MIVSLVDARGTGGVRIWSDRAQAMLGRERFRTLLVGPGAPDDGVEWNEGEDPSTIVLRLAGALADAAIILPNGTVEGYAAATLVPGARALGIAHGRDHTWQEIADACWELPISWVCVSAAVRSVLEPWVGGDAPVIACGVPMADDAVPAAWDGVRPIRLLSLGRVEQRHKRTLDLIALCAHLDSAGTRYDIVIAGDGPDLASLRAALAGNASVILPGQVDAERAASLVRWCDMLVLPSAAEGSPLTAMEAMAAARPVLATTTSGGAAEAISASGGGWLVELGDMASMARTIASMSPQMLRTAGTRGRAHALDAFDLSKTLPAMLEHARQLAGEPAALFKAMCRAGGIVQPSSALRSRFATAWRVSEGTLPIAAPQRPTIRERLMAQALERMPGRIGIYGAGAHTRSLAAWIAGQRRIACILDDRAQPGQMCAGRAVVPPGATAVDGVIVSSDAHEGAMLERIATLLPGVTAAGLYGMDNGRLVEPWSAESAGSCVLAA